MNNVKENVIQSFKWFRQYRFPIRIKDKENYSTCIKKWLEKYINNLENCDYIPDEDVKTIKDYTDKILEAFNKYLNGDIYTAYETFFSAIEPVKSHFRYRIIGEEPNNSLVKVPYYRVNKLGNSKFDYKEMLHIPYNKREIISAYRFSISGSPCSYMSSSPIVAWYEAGMPDECQIAIYNASDRSKLLSLDINIQDEYFNIYRSAFNAVDDVDIAVWKNIADVIYTFPLTAFCSVVKKQDSAKFSEEYIIPQMLMSWVSLNTDFVGIRYRTNKRFELAYGFSAYNIALPATEEDTDHYSKKLKQIFNIEKYQNMPDKLETVKIKEDISKIYGDKIQRLNDFYDTVYEDYRHKNAPVIYKEYLSICRIVLSNVKMLQNEASDESIVSDKKYNALVTLKNLNTWIMSIEKSSNTSEIKIGHNGMEMTVDEIDFAEKNIELFNKEIICILRNLSNIDQRVLGVDLKWPN